MNNQPYSDPHHSRPAMVTTTTKTVAAPVAPASENRSKWRRLSGLAGMIGALVLCIILITMKHHPEQGGTPQLPGATNWPAAAHVTPESGIKDDARHPGSMERIEDRITQLRSKLTTSPDNLEGWVLLSRSLGLKHDYAGAADALEQALALAPGHPDLLTDLADTLSMTNYGVLAGRPVQLLEQALKNAPNQPKALSLAATAAMQENNLPLALSYWQRLRSNLAPNSSEATKIDAYIARAETAIRTYNQNNPKNPIALPDK